MMDMDCDIAAYVASVGETKAMESSLETLVFDGFSVKIFAEGSAKEVLAKNQALKSSLVDFEQLDAIQKYHPKLFLTGSSQEESIPLLKQLEKQGTQTIVLLDNDSLQGKDSFFETARKVITNAKCIFIPNERLKSESVLQEKEIHVVGQCGVDAFVQEAKQVNPEEVLKRLGLDPSKKTLLFLGARGDQYDSHLCSFLEAMNQLSWQEYQIIVKPHPAQSIGFEEQLFFEWKKQKIAHKHPMIFFLGHDSDLSTATLAATADGVACPVSSVATKVAAIGKPIVFFAKQEECQGFTLFELGYGHLYDSQEALEKVLEQESKKELDLYQLLKMPKNSSIRIVALIKNFLLEKQRSLKADVIQESAS